MNYKVPLYIKKKPPYEEFVYEEKENEYRLPTDMLPSVFIKKETYSEIISEEKKRTPNEAIEKGVTELSCELKNELNDIEIIEEITSHTLNEKGEVEVTVEFICREDIAESIPIEKPVTDE